MFIAIGWTRYSSTKLPVYSSLLESINSRFTETASSNSDIGIGVFELDCRCWDKTVGLNVSINVSVCSKSYKPTGALSKN